MKALVRLTGLIPGLRAVAAYGRAAKAAKAGDPAAALQSATEALALARTIPADSASRHVGAAVVIQSTILLHDLGRLLPEPAATKQDLLHALDLCLSGVRSGPARKTARLRELADELRQRIASSDSAVVN
jgi:hypothetical protein